MDSMIIRKTNLLPIEVPGITVLDENGDYNVYLNDKLSCDAQAEAFRHEVEHIKQGHFYRYEDIGELEEQVIYKVE